MKKFFKILAIVAVVIVVILGIVSYATSGMKTTADDFFGAVKQQDMTKARSYLSEEFKASTNEAALKEFLSRSALLNFKEASWSERSVNGDRGELNGSITTETGGHIPIKLIFVKEKETWKIYGLQKPTAGLQSSEPVQQTASTPVAPSTPSIPNNEEQIALARQSMHDFAISLKNKDMEYFRTTISKIWQSQYSTAQLNEAFGKVLQANLDLTVVDPITPILDGDAKMNENGVLTIKGHYPTKPSKLSFECNYVYEGIAWKLSGFYFHIK